MPTPGTRVCFCCGEDNPEGLHLVYTSPTRGAAETTLVVPDRFTGPPDTAHGGFLSIILDETMAWACQSTDTPGAWGFTASLEVRFRKPVGVDTRITATAKITRVRGRIVEAAGKIRDETGAVAATATARFLSGNRADS